MDSLLRNLESIKVTYDDTHKEFIDFFVASKGRDRLEGISAEDKQKKLFDTYYKFLVIAILIGIKNDTTDDKLEKRNSKNETTNIGDFKPRNVVKLILTACITHDSINKPLFEIENMNDSELTEFRLNIRDLIEAFANGGLKILKEKIFDKNNPDRLEIEEIQDVFHVYDDLMSVKSD